MMSLELVLVLVTFLASGIVGAALLSRDDRAGTGFLLGAALGPIGVGVILARRRTWQARWRRQAAGAEDRRKEQAFRDWRKH